MSDQGIENNVIRDIMEQKDSILDKLHNAMKNMSKKLLTKLMEYINLKFRIALARNKIDIDQEIFVDENDIFQMYSKLQKRGKSALKQHKNQDKNTKVAITGKNVGFKGDKATYANVALGLDQFIDDAVKHVNHKIENEINDKFANIEPLLFDTLQNSMKDLGKRMQKSIDTLIQDNIFKLKLISKRASSASARNLIRSGTKNRVGKKKVNKNTASNKTLEVIQNAARKHFYESQTMDSKTFNNKPPLQLKDLNDVDVIDSLNNYENNHNMFEVSNSPQKSITSLKSALKPKNLMKNEFLPSNENKFALTKSQIASSSGVLYSSKNSKRYSTGGGEHRISTSDINNRESGPKSSNAHFISFRKDGLPTDNPLYLQDLNIDVFPHTSKNKKVVYTNEEPEHVGESMSQIKQKLNHEVNYQEILAMRDKIKSMLEFYDASQ